MDETEDARYVNTREQQNQVFKNNFIDIFQHRLTNAPLLSRIMKMMKLSNQLCSTIR